VRSALQYTVWGDLSPEDALVHGRSPTLRTNQALLAPAEAEAQAVGGPWAFRSQARIIEGLMTAHKARCHGSS